MGGVVRSLTILSFDCEFARLATSLVMSHFSKSYHLKDRMESHGQFVNFVQLKKKVAMQETSEWHRKVR